MMPSHHHSNGSLSDRGGATHKCHPVSSRNTQQHNPRFLEINGTCALTGSTPSNPLASEEEEQDPNNSIRACKSLNSTPKKKKQCFAALPDLQVSPSPRIAFSPINTKESNQNGGTNSQSPTTSSVCNYDGCKNSREPSSIAMFLSPSHRYSLSTEPSSTSVLSATSSIMNGSNSNTMNSNVSPSKGNGKLAPGPLLREVSQTSMLGAKRRTKNIMDSAVSNLRREIDCSRMRTMESYNSIVQKKKEIKKDPKFETHLHCYAQNRLGQELAQVSYVQDNNKILDVDDLLNGIFDIDEAKRIRATKMKTNLHHSHPHGHCLLNTHPISASINNHNSLSNALFMKEQMKAASKSPRLQENPNFSQQYAKFLTNKSVKLISDLRKSTEQNSRAVQDVLAYQQTVDPELKAKVKKNLELMRNSLSLMEKAQEKKAEQRKRLLSSRRQHRQSK
ncbi:hypothetical protein C9374_010138 [Naegleria lovaniensis]|uniref:Uncharacterized protein n=1 Tax=Naegleria lovaniensis TaxID=51637 RepID=A0AA88GIE0_NAELO|nr:uncharacterized protein C9374_010138 [Naegleria lovaniensis]KAG2375134.1 hypothetical protein C9374_010138 [Naegleria lovaniensis]